MASELTPEARFEEIQAAVYHALEGAQEDGDGPLSLETEKRVDLLLRMVREALGLPQPD